MEQLQLDLCACKHELKTLASEANQRPTVDGAHDEHIELTIEANSRQVGRFKERLRLIEASLRHLRHSIRGSGELIVSANAHAYAEVRRNLRQYFAQLVPGKEADLVCTADSGRIDDGIGFAIRSGDSGGGGAWKHSCVELSGGQKTLLGLSFLLALSAYRR